MSIPKNMKMFKSINKSNKVCCVNGCHNTTYRNPELHFFRFPGRDYEVERKVRWIMAVQKLNGDSWTSCDSSRICSAHFVGGKKSNIMLDVSYVPTIFNQTCERRMKKRGRPRKLEQHKTKNLSIDNIKFEEVIMENFVYDIKTEETEDITNNIDIEETLENVTSEIKIEETEIECLINDIKVERQ